MSTSHPSPKSRTLFLRPIAVSPTDGFDSLKAAETQVQNQSDDADHEHRGHDEIVPLARISRIDDQITEAGIHRDHFRSDHHQPRDAQSQTETNDNLRKRGWKDDPGEKLRRRKAEVAACAAENTWHVRYAVDARHHNREKCAEKDQEDRGFVAHSKENDGYGDPCHGADGPEDLHHGVHDLVDRRVPSK